MGCEQSKSVKVQPVIVQCGQHENPGLDIGVEDGTQTQCEDSAISIKGEFYFDARGKKIYGSRRTSHRQKQSAKSRKTLGSCESLNDDRSMDEGDRGFSATSKVSKQSTDSGLGEEYSHVITEFSEQHLIEEVENTFQDKGDLQLAVSGTACPTRLSAKEKLRQEESKIMQALREEGLITRPKTKSSGGVSFEIIQDNNTLETAPARPPARLAKLEKRRKKKKVLTEEQIKEKLERAEKRRKKKEEEMVARIKELEKHETVSALENFAQRQKKKEEINSQKMVNVVDNREKKLKEIRERMKERERHAEEVRKRKLVNVDSITDETGEVAAEAS
ncbi:uncharacterized protein LOC126819168 [Patella vulgata]|uniref:uncharacterized protein LOC126819168 n=1 Tax=Patella vulgata TaxID=6465 RepID=UPI0024A97E0F|nr:uncharacterized protein LOC126819168 [Patella vulgata]